jgi:apolipoprotein N-acyltransferase
LAWVALVPFLTLVRGSARPRWLYLSAYLSGLVFLTPALQWMRVADPRMYATWLTLAPYCSLYFLLALFLLRRLDRATPLPLTLTLPLVWTFLEFFRARFIGGFASWWLGSHQHDIPGGFGWYFLGYSQHAFLELIQVADLVGVFGVGFLISAVNGLLFESLAVRAWFRRWVPTSSPVRCSRMSLLSQALALGLLLGAVLLYGSWRLGQEVGKPGPRLALMQGNLDQRIRNQATDAGNDLRKSAQATMREHYETLSDLAAEQKPDLIVWPETSYPSYWEEIAPGKPEPHSQELARELTSHSGCPILLGANACVRCNDLRIRFYNSAVLLDAQGRWQGRYDKTHRVPFGEYIPVRNWLPFLNALAPYDFDYSVQPGEQFTRFPLMKGTQRASFGVMICYEDTDPVMARPYGGSDGSPPADFLINISNDGWFQGTSEHDEHLAICRFRAIECRRAVCRAVNMGISALIDSSGRVLRPQARPVEWRRPGEVSEEFSLWEIEPGTKEQLPVAEWANYKKVAGVLLATVPLDDRSSFYARTGDWLPCVCGGGVLLALLLSRVRQKRAEVV